MNANTNTIPLSTSQILKALGASPQPFNGILSTIVYGQSGHVGYSGLYFDPDPKEAIYERENVDKLLAALREHNSKVVNTFLFCKLGDVITPHLGKGI